MISSLLNDTAIQEFLTQHGQKAFRLNQIHQAVFRDCVADIEDITTLPESLRNAIKEHFVLSPLKVHMDQTSVDGTNKVLFQAQDGAMIESVLMRHKTSRLTLCISSQVGCPVKCVFCSTGTMGYKRNLSFEEIAAQVLYFNQKLLKEGLRVRNIVFMGMGEPLLNYDNVMTAIHILNDPKKFAIGVRHITISTSGIVPRIYDLIDQDIQINLAVSLHAPNDILRTKIMPINNAYPLEKLMEALQAYIEKTGKRIFYEYVMLAGVNDHLSHAYELAHLLKGQLAHINLIPYNPGGAWQELRSTSRTKILAFQKEVQKHGLPVTVRYTFGQDIDAACGQLAAKENAKPE